MNLSSSLIDLLIVRGDLRTLFGYSKALRAHMDAFEMFTKVILGVDIHYHAAFSTEPFRWPIIDDLEAEVAVSYFPGKTIVLNYTTPDRFKRFDNAWNVGFFYWETDRFNAAARWDEAIKAMDSIWVPADFMVEAVKKTGFSGRVRVIPWPHKRTEQQSRPARPLNFERLFSADLFNHARRIRKTSAINALAEARRSLTWDRLAHVHPRMVLSFTQDIPRKGFPLLISEWQAYLESSDSDLGLLVKCSTFDPAAQTRELALKLLNEVEIITAPSHRLKTGIFITFDRHNEEDLDRMYRKSFALVSTTLGEGFGGPVVEAALRNCPVIAPRHSASSSYMPSNYPLSMECDVSSLSLKNQPFYSLSSKWGVIRAGELAQKLRMLETLGGEDRRALASTLCESVLAYCSEDRVRDLFKEACLELYESAH